MEARLSIWKSAGMWWWELKTHDTRLMTPDRFVDMGEASTQQAAFADAEIAWYRLGDMAA